MGFNQNYGASQQGETKFCFKFKINITHKFQNINVPINSFSLLKVMVDTNQVIKVDTNQVIKVWDTIIMVFNNLVEKMMAVIY